MVGKAKPLTFSFVPLRVTSNIAIVGSRAEFAIFSLGKSLLQDCKSFNVPHWLDVKKQYSRSQRLD